MKNGEAKKLGSWDNDISNFGLGKKGENLRGEG